MGNHHLYIVPNMFITLKENPVPLNSHFHLSTTTNRQPRATTSLLSVSMDLATLDVSYAILPTGLQVLGVRELTLVNKVFTGISILVLSFIILSGFIKGDLHNWKLTEQDYILNTSGSTDTSRLEGFSWPL